jgi:erythronate-4-phosphate dehydrogenase
MMYNILADENIPYAEDAFSGIGQVSLINGRDITAERLKNVDILIIRSITRVNKELLQGSPVKFVGTATIGLDHIDVDYLNQNKIGFASAPGCNADSVAEYIFAGLLKFAVKDNFSLDKKSLGIIGYGNIGSRVGRIADRFGMNVLINDPPLQRETGKSFFIPYETALQADILTYHVPLNRTGIDKTYHMLSDAQLDNFDDKKIILNASRGSVVANSDLKSFLTKSNNHVILDVWENEPEIDIELLDLVHTGTPHIAGYSLEGKVNGTIMIYNSLCSFLNIKKKWKPALPEIRSQLIEYPSADSTEESLDILITQIYDIEQDDLKLRRTLEFGVNERGEYFDLLRKNYPVRREFTNYTVRISEKFEKEIQLLKALRFYIETY